MRKTTINGLESNKTTSLWIANDDGVWLHPTTNPKDLVQLVENPYKWIKKIKIVTPKGKKRSAKLAKNFVISLDIAAPMNVANGTTPTAYVVDGIDKTGFITVRMEGTKPTGTFHAEGDYAGVEEAIKKLNPKVVVLQAGDRVFLHLHLGKEPALRDALLCSAIENQDWLCKLLGSLAKLDGRKLTFTTRASAPRDNMAAGDTSQSDTSNQLEITYQGSQSGVTNQDTCNVDSGTVSGDVVTLDTFIIKTYPPTPGD